jgi:hypothetical protein
MDLYVSFRHLLDQLPKSQALFELTRISVHLQHNTADYCLGCASCPFEETCRRRASTPVQQPEDELPCDAAAN